MKNKMLTACTSLLLMAVVAMAQTQPVVTETMYLLPKRGMNEKFETAVKAHNTKYHPEGQYVAGLRSVDYGAKAGWYVWLMGPTSYSALDTRPDAGAHNEDWEKTVDPLVEEYGTTDLWEYNASLSYGRDLLLKAGNYDVWAVDVKRGELVRCKEILEKMKKTYESMGNRSFLVYENMIHTPGNADISLITSYTNYADWGADWGVKAAYEKLHGSGSWQNMLNTWMEVTVDYTEELRSFVK